MIRIISIFFLLAMTTALPAQSLEDLIQLALTNNPGIRAKDTEFKAALQKLPQVGALPDPQVNLSIFLNPMMLPMGNQLGSISVMQMFPWPGTLRAKEEEATRMAEVSRQQITVAENQLVYQVKSAWFPLLELDEQLQVRRENLRILEADKELATVKFQQGTAPMVDAIRADIMIDEIKTEIALLEQKRRPLEAALNLAIGRNSDIPVSPEVRLPEVPLTTSLPADSLVVSNPALMVFDKRILATEAELAVAGTMRKPMIGAGLQFMPLNRRQGDELALPPNTGKDMIMPMLSVSIPIWKKKYDAAEEEKRLMQQMYIDMKEDMRNELSAEYQMAVYEMQLAAQTISLLDLQLQKTQQAIDLLLSAYSNAGLDFEEILRMQQQLFRYQMEKISMQKEYQLALAQVDYLTGR